MHSTTTEATKARIAAIHQFYKPGMSAKKMAEKLSEIENIFVSKMVVIGIYKRNADYLRDVPLPPPSREKKGLGRRRPRPEPSERQERPAHQKRAYTRHVIKHPSNVLPFVIPDTAFTYIPTAPTKQLYQLEAHECRWPMNGVGADMQFCSQHAEGSYCPHHQRLSVGKGTASERGALRAARRMA